MFVSSLPSASKSLSFRLVRAFWWGGDLDCDILVDIDMILSAGEAAPDCVLPCAGAFECVLAVEGLELGGRIECFLVAKPAAGRGRPAIEYGSSFSRDRSF